MSIWRPVPRIRVIALGLHWREGRLLAAAVRDDRGCLKGVRPLGGGVEFGERAECAVRREFREELGLEVAVRGPPAVLENIYLHEGASGHEVAFVFEVELPGHAVAGRDSLAFREDDGVADVARWYDVRELDREGGPALYPTGLKELLAARQLGQNPLPS